MLAEHDQDVIAAMLRCHWNEIPLEKRQEITQEYERRHRLHSGAVPGTLPTSSILDILVACNADNYYPREHHVIA